MTRLLSEDLNILKTRGRVEVAKVRLIWNHLFIYVKSAAHRCHVDSWSGRRLWACHCLLRAKVDRRHTQTIACLPLTSLAVLVIMRINICLKYERVCVRVWTCNFETLAVHLNRRRSGRGLDGGESCKWLLTRPTANRNSDTHSRCSQLSSSVIRCEMWNLLFVICNSYDRAGAGVRLTRTVALWLCYEIEAPL